MSDVIKDLYEVIQSRRESADENSYTAYLFREGLDKILKKVGEESAETIIAAKSLESLFKTSSVIADGSGKEFTIKFAELTNKIIIDEAREDLANETADLIYHVLVMLVERGMSWEEVERVLEERANKTGNLKSK
jgi:phosphoribosyl-ATP pyrophosphohydrolase